MNLKNIFNKPYKYGFIFKYNKYCTIYNIFTIITNKINNLQYTFKLKKTYLKNIYKKTYNTLYKSFLIFQLLNNRLDIFFLKIGLCKTINQSKYLINYGKILVNNILIKNSNFQLQKGDYIKIIQSSYNNNIKNNIKILKTYLFNYKLNNNISSIIININKYKIYFLSHTYI